MEKSVFNEGSLEIFRFLDCQIWKGGLGVY